MLSPAWNRFRLKDARSALGLQAVQLVALPAIVSAVLAFASDSPPLHGMETILASAVGIFWAGGSLLLARRAALAQFFLAVATGVFCYVVTRRFWMDSEHAFPILALGIFHLGFTWQRNRQIPKKGLWRLHLELAVLASSCFALALWLLVGILGLLTDPHWRAPVALAAAGSLGYALAALVFDRRLEDRKLRHLKFPIAAAILLVIASIVAEWPISAWWTPAVTAFIVWFYLRIREKSLQPIEAALFRPELTILLSFVVAGILGAALLLLADGGTNPRLTLINALFTSVSAVSITGLTVLDTSTEFSPLGQAIILFLVQAGGLGIMAFSAVVAFILGKRLSLREENMLVGAAAYRHRGRIRGLLRNVLFVTFTFEAIGAAVLFVSFWSAGDGAAQAAWRAVFTAISAFCNAGFVLQSDSLIGFRDNPTVLNTVAALVVAGGLSPGYLLALGAITRGERASLQVKSVTMMTLILLLGGTILILSLEWVNSLAGLPFGQKVTNAWFQSVTTRSSGFNTVAMEKLHPATMYVMMALMFIGGSPGGTAGGIKTTTVFILLAAVVGAFSGEGRINVYGRRISAQNVYKAAAVATAGILVGFVAVVGMTLTQNMAPLTLLFEVVSALGTVGLSLGGTALLDEVGKAILIVCMIAGRVGPITLFLLLGRPEGSTPWRLPDEEMIVT